MLQISDSSSASICNFFASKHIRLDGSSSSDILSLPKADPKKDESGQMLFSVDSELASVNGSSKEARLLSRWWTRFGVMDAPARRSRAISFLVGCKLDSGCACTLQSLSDVLQRPSPGGSMGGGGGEIS
ncbi:hypothetical protein HNY73_015653 [Argiope bruennichi]|uniref:Uncharacterized protein n=1 Tax=Argiope bruennichi TaxID=94029 RepID=A0A8T0EQV3_ARGBR|nr:hypothetical protein HNY73_015653 [Argiope bruennichi]